MPSLLFERVYYYWRHSLYGHVHILCSQFIKMQGNDPQFIIWDALAYGAEGKTSQGLSTLDKLKSMLQSQLAINYAKLWIHKKAKMQDFASISEIENDIEVVKKSASASSVVQAAQILWLTGDTQTAFQLAQPLAQQQPPNRDASAIIGWIKLTEGDRNSGRWFDLANSEASLTARNVDPFVLYGKALYFANVNKWQESLTALVQLAGIADFPESNLERARVYVSSRSWDLALEAAQEGAGHYVSDIEFHFLSVLHDLAISGNLENARNSTKTLCDLVMKYESENAEYISIITNVILGLSWSDKQIIQTLLPIFTRALKANEENPNLLTVYGKLLVANGQSQQAISQLQTAVVQDGSSEAAYAALIEAYINMNNMNDAQSQLMFFETMGSPDNPPLMLCTLKERMARLNELPTNVDSLLVAMKKHVDSVYQSLSSQSQSNQDGVPGTYKLMVDRFVDMILSLKLADFEAAMTEAMEHCSTLERTVADPKNGPVCDLIDMMLEFIPGAVPFNYYLAVLGFGEGRYAQATKAIQFVLNSHWGYNASQCHLLLAQIRLQMKQFDEAEAALNRAVSFDFGIRSSLKYNMILAQLNDARGQYDKAIETATALTKTGEFMASQAPERLTVILFIAKVYKRSGKFSEALKIVDDALTKFSGTSEEGQIKLFKASLLAKSDHVPDGLAILETFDSKSPLFSKARKVAAKIYLNVLKDKASYIKCFRQLVEVAPNKTNYLLLGDALMNVKRFTEAVDNFKQALEEDPGDSQVALHLARGFMIIHAFNDALEAYQHAISLSNDNKVVLEYCKTEYKLHHYEEAMDTASEAMDNIEIETADWEGLYLYAQFAEVMSIIELKLNNEENKEQAANYISTAISCLDKLTAPTRTDVPGDKLVEIKKKASDLNYKNAESLLDEGQKEEAVEALKKAADLDDTSTKASLTLARIYLHDNKVNEATEICQQILRNDPNCEEAAIILADISANESIAELQKAFTSNPTFYRTLVRLIEVCARAGQLDTIQPYLDQCDKTQAGYIFCQGLYEYYCGNPQKAIEHFYAIRNDPDWGINAQVYSFHIKANPSRKFPWCETKPLATPKDLEGAEKALKRLRNQGVDTLQMEATLLLSRNTQETVQQALDIYNSMKSDDPSTVVGMCRCFIRLNQQQNATRYLNSIIHSEPKPNEISSYVEAFLMMTQISIKDSSFDEAEKYVNQAIQLDKSCGKAWEMLASLYEKKKDYDAAATALEGAWKLTSQSDCYIGYRLAVAYMKAKLPVEAIKVSRTVLAKHPNFPKVKEQILIPCCGMIRQ